MQGKAESDLRSNNEKSIGIIGGVGPYAGIDLMTKILDQTQILKEQDHLPVTLLSYANRIPDRSEFLLGQIEENPAEELFNIIQTMSKIGVSVAAISCNTAHVPEIFDVVQSKLKASGLQLKLLHIVEAVIEYLKNELSNIQKIGVLSTSGSYTFQLYESFIGDAGLTAIRMPQDLQESLVHVSIYDHEFGIKTTSPKINPMAVKKLKEAVKTLINQGAEAIIMGCTEIPLALTENNIDGTMLIDPNWVLARALINDFDSSKLI